MPHHSASRALSAVLALMLIASAPSLADFGSAMGLYQNGDYAAALKEFTVLAGQGDADAQFILGDMYAQGQGVGRDNVQAWKWYDIAAKSGAQGAAEVRDALGKSMNAEDLDKAQQLAQEWRPDTTAAANPAPAPAAPVAAPAAAPAPEAEGGFFKNLSRTVTGLTGGTGTASQSSTSVGGVRGLDAEMLRTASPDLQALQKMESFASNKSEAEGFAQNARLVAQNVPYIETQKECAPAPSNALQSAAGSC